MYKTSLRFWLEETSEFPINNIALACNYLLEFYGNRVILGNNIVKNTLSESCIENLVLTDHLKYRNDGAFDFSYYA